MLVSLLTKLVSFQMSFIFNFFTFPITVFNFCVKKVLHRFYLRLISSIFSSLHSYKLRLIQAAARFGRGVLCSLYVFLLLLLLLISSFAVSGIVMAVLTEAPILFTQALNFDYTKSSPSAFVPIPPKNMRSPSYSFNGGRAISPSNRMRLTISLTLPESEHNRKLGIFQVRAESLSAKDGVIVSSSYPTMLRFKSQGIRAIESSMKMLPLVAGLKSEAQNVKIVVEEFGEAMMGFKVSLEKRARVEDDGSGVPQIYGGSLDIESELPLFRRMVWNWRLTMFVWIGFSSFMAGIMVLLLFCRSILLPGRNNGVKRRRTTE